MANDNKSIMLLAVQATASSKSTTSFAARANDPPVFFAGCWSGAPAFDIDVFRGIHPSRELTLSNSRALLVSLAV